MRIRLNAQPFALLLLLLERPGELVTREEIAARLWPEGTFVDYEHGVNSAINRIREALRDSSSSPRYVETLARRGYRFVAPVARVGEAAETGSAWNPPSAEKNGGRLLSRLLAPAEELPATPPRVARGLFLLLQLTYLGFYVGALANLGEIDELVAALPRWMAAFNVIVTTAAVLIPLRAFLLTAVLFRPPRAGEKLLRLWPLMLAADELWALAPFLLLNHMSAGLAVACVALLVWAPFAERSLVLMGAVERE